MSDESRIPVQHTDILNIRTKTDRDRLLDIASRPIAFLSHEGQPYVSFFYGDGGRQVLPLRSHLFRDWVLHNFTLSHNRAPQPTNLRSAFQVVEAFAEIKPAFVGFVFRRVGAYGERFGPTIPEPTKIVVDIKNPAGEAVEITPEGWCVAEGEPYCFLRSSSMLVLAHPEPRSSAEPIAPCEETLTALRQLLRPASDADFTRILIWLLAAFRGIGPYPVLLIEGPAECGKTTAAALLRHLIDPSSTPFTKAHHHEEKILRYAWQNYVVGFDDIHRLTPRLASVVSRLAMGMSHHLTEPNTRRDIVSFHLQRPIILTFNGASLERYPSVAARALRVRLNPDGERPATDVWTDFRALRPRLLATLFSATSTALKDIAQTTVTHPPRLADTAQWATAAAPSVGLTPESILDALSPPNPLAAAIVEFMSQRDTWTGTATELLKLLPPNSGAESPKSLGIQLRHIDFQLAAAGITYSRTRNEKKRLFTFQKGPTPDKFPDTNLSFGSRNPPKDNKKQ
ncbi:MAG: hypothetical protein GY953_25735 [bacterium]|nr:hypothetical protein [bacterium]